MSTNLRTLPLQKANIQIPVKNLQSAPRSLPVMQIAQEQSQWCWAACAEMCIQYFGGSVQQCEIANFIKTRNDCCVSPSSSACNESCRLNDVARIFTNWGIRCNPLTTQVSFADLVSEINASRPVEVGLDWIGGGGGHLVIVRGYNTQDGRSFVQVNDADDTTGWATYESLRNGFGRGQWGATWTNISQI